MFIYNSNVTSNITLSNVALKTKESGRSVRHYLSFVLALTTLITVVSIQTPTLAQLPPAQIPHVPTVVPPVQPPMHVSTPLPPAVPPVVQTPAHVQALVPAVVPAVVQPLTHVQPPVAPVMQLPVQPPHTQTPVLPAAQTPTHGQTVIPPTTPNQPLTHVQTPVPSSTNTVTAHTGSPDTSSISSTSSPAASTTSAAHTATTTTAATAAAPHHSSEFWANLTPDTSNGTANPSINLNLSSTSANMTASHLPQSGSVVINVGGIPLTVTSKTQLTPAEFLAVRQIQFTGQQSLVINSQGAATGGTVIIGSHLSQQLNSLNIPHGVTVIDLSRSGILNLFGNVTDAGNLYVGSFNHTINTISLTANNISVQPNGLISNMIPAGVLPTWLTKPDSIFNLSLIAQNNIVNNGTISSGGALSLAAGHSINNGVLQGGAGVQAVMQAVKNVDISVGSGNLTNAGLISSRTGSINIVTPRTATDLNIASTGGTYQAFNGQINLRDQSYNGSANMTLTGGDWLSKEFNINAGQGAVTGTVGLVSGTMNVNAGAAHLVANTPTLALGNAEITGDPTFANTGNITIDGTISPSEAIAIIAGGNITATSTGSIHTAGNNITLIAGADITSGSSPGDTTILSGSTGAPGTVTMQFNNSAGGNIDFTASTASNAISTSGGNLILLAHSNSAGTGNIWFPTSTAISTANSSGFAGSVLVVAGGNGGTSVSGPISQAIQLGNIVTTSNFGGGSVTIAAAQPVITSGPTATFDLHGNTTATFGAGSVSNGSINISSINATETGGSVSISSGGTLTTGAIYTFNSGSGNAGNITLTSAFGGINADLLYARAYTGTGGSITLNSGNASFHLSSLYTNSTRGAPGALTFQQSGTVLSNPTVFFAPNSNILVGGTTASNVSNVTLTLGNTNPLGVIYTYNSGSGNAGNISLTSPGAISTSILTASANTGTGGNITLDSANGTFNLNSLYTSSSSGAPGTLTFKEMGVILPTPVVSFATGSNIDVHGNTSANISNISFILANTNPLGIIYTDNSGSGNAGSISLFSPGAISTGTLNASANSGMGGNITLDSANATFNLSTIFTDSVSNAPGTLTFRQFGIPLFNPTVSFAPNSSIYLSGATSSNIQNLTLTLGNTNPLNNIATYNAGSGNAGSITINSANAINIAGLYTFAGTGTGGNITLNSGNTTFNLGGIYAFSTNNTPGYLTFQQSGVTLANPTVSFIPGSNIELQGSTSSNIHNLTLTLANTNPLGVVYTFNSGSGNAGSISLTSPGALSTNILAADANFGTGGNITLDSANGVFNLNSLYTSSVHGAPGILSFKQSGVTLTNPTVSFATGSNIDVHGKTSSDTSNINIRLANADPLGYISTANAGSGNAGNITLTSPFSITTGDLSTFNSGTGNSGNIVLTSPFAITFGRLYAIANVGIGGNVTADAGTSITGTSSIYGRNVTLTAHDGNIDLAGLAYGSQSLTLTASNNIITASNLNSAAIYLSAGNNYQISGAVLGIDTSTGNGGTIKVFSPSLNPLVIGGHLADKNFITGDVRANGINGGRIDLFVNGGVVINAGSSVLANGISTGTGGMIQFASLVPTAGPITVVNNGTIDATNGQPGTSGIVAFNGGPSHTVTLTGSGTVHAGYYVGFGNIDPVTLAVINYIIIPTTNAFSVGLVNVSQGGVILNQIRVTGAIPPNNPGLPPSPINPTSTNSASFALLQLLRLFQLGVNQNQDRLFEQLGTRIPTDYTPYTRYPWRPIRYPLQGNVTVERLAAVPPGEARFAGTSFNAEELAALNTQGIVFGPNSKDNYFDLVQGYVLFTPKNNITVQTREGSVSIPKNAVAWIMETGHDVAIYDLHDSVTTRYIKVNVNNTELTLSPGTQLLLTRNPQNGNVEDDFVSLNPGNPIGYRNVRKRDLGNGVYGYICNFPIVGALGNVSVINSLLATNDPADKTTAIKMLKNAAILDDLGNYPTYRYGTLIAGGTGGRASLAGGRPSL